VVLDIWHNGNTLKGDKFEWPLAVILGLQLAHQYWWPHMSYPFVRDAFRSQATSDPTLWTTFRLDRVINTTQQHKAATMR
jgi:hypothetical protein